MSGILAIFGGGLIGALLGGRLAQIRDMWGYANDTQFLVTAVATVAGAVVFLLAVVSRGRLRHGIIGATCGMLIVVLAAIAMDRGADEQWGIAIVLLFAPLLFLPAGFALGTCIGRKSRKDQRH